MKKLIILTMTFLWIHAVSAQTYLLGPQEFNSNIMTHGTSAPTTAWFAPDFHTPIAWVSSGGNPGGYIGFSGSWNDYWGNFVRLPQINCSGHDTVILSFDMSHSYFAAQPNDWIRFYLWDQGGSGQYRNNVAGVKIDGVESMVSFGANGYGFRFNVARTWARVEVKFYLNNVINKTNVLFYFEPNCSYNNSNTYFVRFDNVGITTNPVLQAAQIDGQSGNRSRCEGDSVTFTVYASGTAPLSYQWKRNGFPMAGADSSVLYIPSVTTDTAGTYYCVVSNGLGSDSSSAVTLTVWNLPQVDLGNDTTLCVNQTLALDAGPSFSSYNWSSGGSGQFENIIGSLLGIGSHLISVMVTDGNGCSASDAILVTFDPCTGEDEYSSRILKVFPNPASGSFRIMHPGPVESLVITDLQGRTAASFTSDALTAEVHCDQLLSGFYIIQCLLKDGSSEYLKIQIIR